MADNNATESAVVHDEYILNLPIWEKCRTAYDGEEAVHNAGETYLPRLDSQSDENYEAYKSRARWFNATAKTVTGNTGLVMRNKVQLVTDESVLSSDEYATITNNIDLANTDIQTYIKQVLEDVQLYGRSGTLLDYTKENNYEFLASNSSNVQVLPSFAGEKTVLRRPFWAYYKPQSILDWEFTDGILSYVLLLEIVDKYSDYYLTYGTRKRYRALFLENGEYVQRIYTRFTSRIDPTNADNNDLIEEIVPLVNGKPLSFIPFIIHQPDFSPAVNKPPLLDLVNMNFAHYRLKADHAHALHYVALPTPYIIGIDPNDPNAPKTIGPQKIWIVDSYEAKVGMLEYSGAGVSSIKEELESIEEQMAVIGARLLIANQGIEKTATSAKIKSISETADLSSIVMVLNKQFNDLFKMTIHWAFGTPFEETSLSISNDFIPLGLDSQMVLALVHSWLKGAIDFETLSNNLQRGELVSPARTIESLKDSINEERDWVLELITQTSMAESANIDTPNLQGNPEDPDNPATNPTSVNSNANPTNPSITGE